MSDNVYIWEAFGFIYFKLSTVILNILRVHCAMSSSFISTEIEIIMRLYRSPYLHIFCDWFSSWMEWSTLTVLRRSEMENYSCFVREEHDLFCGREEIWVILGKSRLTHLTFFLLFWFDCVIILFFISFFAFFSSIWFDRI